MNARAAHSVRTREAIGAILWSLNVPVSDPFLPVFDFFWLSAGWVQAHLIRENIRKKQGGYIVTGIGGKLWDDDENDIYVKRVVNIEPTTP